MSFTPDYVRYILKGDKKFYTWMGFLAFLSAIALYGFYAQNTEGLIVTGLTSQIHDGLYFANLVFLVGVAAGAVTIVFPAYVHHHKAMHEVTVPRHLQHAQLDAGVGRVGAYRVSPA